MPFASALSTHASTQTAIEETCAQASAGLGGSPDLALVFFSAHHSRAARELVTAAQERLAPRCLLGCPGQAIVSDDRELEQGPALSLWLARWNQPTTLTSFHLALEQTSEGASLLGWPDVLHDIDPAQAFVLLLADPFTFPVDDFLKQVNEDYRGLRVMGGMASGGREPGHNPLVRDAGCVHEGAVGAVVQGPIRVRSVVSQGCRPIGRPLVITKAHENVIIELGGKPPLLQLQELWPTLSERDQKLAREGLHIGCVLNEYQETFQQGDFLIRNIVGLDKTTGALAIAHRVRIGQTVQFHVRDATTADEDLHELLRADAGQSQRPGGALLFSCNGRGLRLFEQPDHDARVVRAEAGAVPLAGFFAMGELGPVGGQNFIHGFTASVVLFEDA